ncbi:MAG TPA: zinc dependent phospholipase C family protein, partial [Chitinophagaceae bacterium]|nr:zinc dependent phospholipase C family protein [Chitinophagaceae bacterium]
MKKVLLIFLFLVSVQACFGWGFYAHRLINRQAVFLLPPEMMVLFKPHIQFLEEHAVDPDKRRYVSTLEAPRHYIDLDHYGHAPFDSLPRNWNHAVEKFSEDTLKAYGIVPWWLQTMLHRLTDAFKEKNQAKILKYAAEIGHYIADAHVPLHATRNHNGQYTNQHGIHGFWESRIPELLAETEWDFFIGQAAYISRPSDFIWARVMESAAAVDTVLAIEKELSDHFSPDQKFAFEERNGLITRQYSSAFSKQYDARLDGMIERRMRQSIFATASFWYTAWVNAGQPDLRDLSHTHFSKEDLEEFEAL